MSFPSAIKSKGISPTNARMATYLLQRLQESFLQINGSYSTQPVPLHEGPSPSSLPQFTTKRKKLPYLSKPLPEVTSKHESPTHKLIELKGSRNGNIWTKAEGRGHKHGFDLKEEFDSRNLVALPDLFEFSSQKYKNALCSGTRKLLGRKKVEEGGKTVEKLRLGDYEWKTYEETQEEILKVAAALIALGLKKGDRVVILAETRYEWFTSALGCLRNGLTIVTLYTTLPDSGILHGISETEVSTIFTSHGMLPRLSKLLPQCELIRNIIVFEDQLEGIGETNVSLNVKTIPFQTLLTQGNVDELTEESKPAGDDDAIIMYTSGSSGKPKGVKMSHTNIYYSVIAYTVQANLSKEDRYIAFLPLAHVMELITEMGMVSLGVRIAYSSPFTLTNNGLNLLRGTPGDIICAKPTSISVVPLVLDRIIKGVFENVEKQGKFKAKIFKEALKYKENYDRSFVGRLFDILIFNKVKAELGGSVKMMVVGGAPISPQTHRMIKAMLGCTLQIGYGCTETSASAASVDSDDNVVGHVGPPNPFVQIKLEDWEEGEYKTTDSPRPRGEIIVGGPCVANGYFRLDSDTSESFFKENGVQWFRTGDIGEFDESGVLYVIDRKKDLVKLKHGEYISLGNIESKLKTSSLVENICVFADSHESSCVAIVTPSNKALQKISENLHILEDLSFDKLCEDQEVNKAFTNQLKLHAKESGLCKWETPKSVHLTSKIWTPDNGLVTAGLKLKRESIALEYKHQINALYGQTDSDVA